MSNSIKRPTVTEEEEDLLRLQREFLEKNETGSVKIQKRDVINVDNDHVPMNTDNASTSPRKRKFCREPVYDDARDINKALDRHDTDLHSVLTNICEMNIRNQEVSAPKPSSRAFPSVSEFRLQSNVPCSSFSKQKKSLFAQQFDRKYNFTPKRVVKERFDPEVLGPSAFLSNVLPNERQNIENETNKMLSKMSEEEKKQEAERIFKNMDPKLVEFLKKRKKEAQDKTKLEQQDKREQLEKELTEKAKISLTKDKNHGPKDIPSCCDAEHKDSYFLNPVMKEVEIDGSMVEVPIYVKPGHHPNMGTLEADKLQWMSNLPKTGHVTSSQEEGDKTDDDKMRHVRFDFDGKIIPKGTQVHLDRGLHHHGEEQNEAGYTLEELFILSRSAVTRQREIALETLVHITQRARHSLFSRFVQQPMLKLLLDSGIVQLFRHGLDSAQWELSLQGLAALLVSPTEILIQDQVYPTYSRYTLQPEQEITKDMDHDTVLANDAVRLIVESQLPQRFWYLLSKEKHTFTMVDNILNVIHHVVQHSLHVAMLIVNHEILLDLLVEMFLPTDLNHFMSYDQQDTSLKYHPSYIVVKICRILCSYGRHTTNTLLKRYNLDQVIKLYICLNSKDFEDSKQKAVLDCQIECIRLWGVLLQFDTCSGIYTAVYPLLVRELNIGGQCSVKLTCTLINTLSDGLANLSWSDVGCLYQPILTNVLTWANKPPSGNEIPPKDDMLLLSSVLKFLNTFLQLHHSKHYSVHLVDQVADLVDRVIRPFVTGALFDNAVHYLIFTKCFINKAPLSCDHHPTLELHQYHKKTKNESDTLDFSSLSEDGEKLCTFYSCTGFVREIIRFMATAYNINKNLSEVVQGFLEKSSTNLLKNLDRLRRYENGKLSNDVPDLIFQQILLMQYDYVMLSLKIAKKNPKLFEPGMLLRTGIKLLSDFRASFEYHQFQLLTIFLFDQAIQPNVSCSHLFMKNFEKIVSRNTIMKSQKYWSPGSAVSDPNKSLYAGKLVTTSDLNNSWTLLSLSVLSSLNEHEILGYLKFLSHLISVPDALSSIPIVVQLIRVMEVFLLPQQHFLTKEISDILKQFLDYFSKFSYIDFTKSSLTGHASFYDFYNLICENYEAAGYCDPVFAGFVLLPTRCDYAVTYRRLIWVERVETLRVLRTSHLPLATTLRATETDADMMALYASALKNNIPHLPRLIALHHVAKFLFDDRITKSDELLRLVKRHLSQGTDDLKEAVLKFDQINEFNELVLYEKVIPGRAEKL